MHYIKIKGTESLVIIDDDDLELVSNKPWRAQKKKNGIIYAVYDIRITKKICIKRLMHRIIMKTTDSKIIIDHKNRNGLDNRKENLRRATNSQNLANSLKRKNSTSKYKGVSWDTEKNKWRCSIQYKQIGRFNSEKEAAEAYNIKTKEIWGEFAYLNKL